MHTFTKSYAVVIFQCDLILSALYVMVVFYLEGHMSLFKLWEDMKNGTSAGIMARDKHYAWPLYCNQPCEVCVYGPRSETKPFCGVNPQHTIN